MPDRPETPGATAAAAYLRSRPWERILDAVRERYISLGRPGGTALVPQPSGGEIAAVRDFFGRPPKIDAAGSLRVPLAQLDERLRASRFGCSLHQCLEAYYDASLITRSEQRNRESNEWDAFVAELTDRLELLADATGSPSALNPVTWWKQTMGNPQSTTMPFIRSHWRPCESNTALFEAVLQVGRALAALCSGMEAPTDSQRLPIFANRVCGDPHAFDSHTLAGRLLERAILDTQPGAGALADTTSSPTHRRDLLLSCVGLQRDDLSSTVLAWGLSPGPGNDPSIARSLLALRESRSIVAFPLWEINRIRDMQATGGCVYVVENPAVFGHLVEAAIEADVGTRALICTSGQLSVAALALIDKLVAGGATLLYSGDFDVGGLAIAAGILARYPAQSRPWHMDVPGYREALARAGRQAFSAKERQRLERLEGSFPELTRKMLATEEKAYQEGLFERLRQDFLERTV